jgi:hypothetical protein
MANGRHSLSSWPDGGFGFWERTSNLLTALVAWIALGWTERRALELLT